MTSPAAKGERFLAVDGAFMSILDIAKVLKDRMGDAGRRVPTRQLPDWLIRFGAAFDRAARQILPELGRNKQAVSDKAKAVLGWQPRGREDAILASGESMLQLGLIKPSRAIRYIAPTMEDAMLHELKDIEFAKMVAAAKVKEEQTQKRSGKSASGEP